MKPSEKKHNSSFFKQLDKTLENIEEQKKHPHHTIAPKPTFRRKHAAKIALQCFILAATIISLAIPVVNVVVAMTVLICAASIALLGWKNRHFNWRWLWAPLTEPFYHPELAPKSGRRRALKNSLLVFGILLAIAATIAAPPLVPAAVALVLGIVGIIIVVATLIDYAHKFLFHHPKETLANDNDTFNHDLTDQQRLTPQPAPNLTQHNTEQATEQDTVNQQPVEQDSTTLNNQHKLTPKPAPQLKTRENLQEKEKINHQFHDSDALILTEIIKHDPNVTANDILHHTPNVPVEQSADNTAKVPQTKPQQTIKSAAELKQDEEDNEGEGEGGLTDEQQDNNENDFKMR